MGNIIMPHKGPQTQFLTSPADIIIYGGSAGGGKSMGLCLDACRHVAIPNYEAIMFRRTTPQLTRAGGLWDTSKLIYPHLQGHPNNQKLLWKFPANSRVSMTHIEYEKNLADHDGAQYAWIGFDELIHFPENFFWYLFSRNRSVCGVKPVIRCATNPCPESHPTGSYVRKLVDWYIADEEYEDLFGIPRGTPRPDRAGKIRYFARDEKSGEIIWVSKNWRSSDGDEPISFTFIPARLEDNHTLMKKDKKYRMSLNMLDEVERKRLKDGNWDSEYENGMFKKENFKVIRRDDLPSGLRKVRYWDLAGTEPSPKNPDPDWTAGARVCMDNSGRFFIMDMECDRLSPYGNQQLIRATAEADTINTEVYIEQEPGSAGKSMVHQYANDILRGFTCKGDRPDADKILRAKPWCALSERGMVFVVEGDWNEKFLNQVSTFPFGPKRDMVDAVSGGYKIVSNRPNIDPMGDWFHSIEKTSVQSGFE